MFWTLHFKKTWGKYASTKQKKTLLKTKSIFCDAFNSSPSCTTHFIHPRHSQNLHSFLPTNLPKHTQTTLQFKVASTYDIHATMSNVLLHHHILKITCKTKQNPILVKGLIITHKTTIPSSIFLSPLTSSIALSFTWHPFRITPIIDRSLILMFVTWHCLSWHRLRFSFCKTY